jgi:hypothetical protein
MIYFIGNKELNICKIGFSNRPYRRIESIRKSTPFNLEIFAIVEGTIQDEKIYHSKYNEYRIKGEWFKLKDVKEIGFNKELKQILIGDIILNINNKNQYVHIPNLLAQLNRDRLLEGMNKIDFITWRKSNKSFLASIPDSIINDSCFWCHIFVAYELIRNSTIKNKIMLYEYLCKGL